MKKVIAVCVGLLLITSWAFAVVEVENKQADLRKMSADGIVMTGRGVLKGVLAVPDGTNKCTCQLYNSTTATVGKEFTPAIAEAGSSSTSGWFSDPIPFDNLYLDLTNCTRCDVFVGSR